jgi:hypothetical protein
MVRSPPKKLELTHVGCYEVLLRCLKIIVGESLAIWGYGSIVKVRLNVVLLRIKGFFPLVCREGFRSELWTREN